MPHLYGQMAFLHNCCSRTDTPQSPDSLIARIDAHGISEMRSEHRKTFIVFYRSFTRYPLHQALVNAVFKGRRVSQQVILPWTRCPGPLHLRMMRSMYACAVNSLILSDNARIIISIPFMTMDFQSVANLAAVSGPQSFKFAAGEPRLAHKSYNTTGRNKLLRDEIYGKI